MEYILCAIIGYFLGSFPTAYILVRKLKGVDIRSTGSSNVGTLNSFKVSKSKFVAVSVLVIDLLKGLASVYLAKIIFGEEFVYPMIALFFAVLGHCYSPWLKFNGGRGLATAAGGALLLAPVIALIWIVLWVIAYIFRKNVHFANIAATILTAALSLTSSDILNKYSFPPAPNSLLFGLAVTLTLAVILSRHIQPLKEYFQVINNKKRGEQNETS